MNLTQEEQIKDKILTRLDIIQNSILLSPQINQSINLIIDCLKKGNKIILFGNGGSAAIGFGG